MALPDPFVQRFQAIYPKEADALLPLFYAPKPLSFRINPLKIDPEEALKRLRAEGFDPKAVDWYDPAFTLPPEDRDRLVRSPLFESGEIYIQSLSSMLAPLVLNPQPGDRVLDLAAAPGGKTLMMAAMMRNEGLLSAVEPGRDRFFRLKANLDRGGVTIAKCYKTDGRGVGRKTPERFDKVMLDAPCSTEAKFRSFDPETTRYWSEKKIKEMAKLQTRLLFSAYQALKPGGTLLYATCSFAHEENEAVIDKLLKKAPDAAIKPIDLALENRRNGLTQWGKKAFDDAVTRCVRILPTETMEGFFLAKIQKEP